MGLTFSVASHADNLLSLYQRALLASPELSGSQYALDIARAQEDQAFGKLLPQAALRGNYSGNRLKRESFNANDYPGTSASINVRQPLFDLQAYLLMKSQQSRTEQGEEALLAAHQQLIADLVERYVDALEAADKSEIIRAELSSTEQQLERVKAMNERQMALVTDLFELQARVETLRTSLIESNNDAKIALEKLRELTGDAVTDIQPVRLDSTQPPPDGSVETWIQQANSINPDLNALKHAVASADQSIDAYQAGHLPRLELQASGNYSNTTYNNQQSPPYEVGTVGVEATIPIYEGGITSARVREAEGRKGVSSSQLEQKLREIEKITRATYLDMASSPARNQATDRQLDASEKAKRAMEKGYELGVVTIIDLLNAQKQLSEAHKVQRQARYRYFKARSSLLQQSGRLDVEELAKLNDWLMAEPVVNTVAEPATKPVVNTVAKPATKPVVNAIAKPVTKPVVNAVAKPVIKPAVNFVDTPKTKPVVTAVAKPVIKPAVNRPKIDSDCGGVHIDYRNPKYKHCLSFTPPATH
jgi:outer membrane protein